MISSIEANGCRINRHVPAAAELLLQSYHYWRHAKGLREFGDDDGAHTDHEWPDDDVLADWSHEARCWENVQLNLWTRGPDDHRLVVAAVPGSNELSDWSSGNLNLFPVKIGGLPGRWRRGFALAGEWVWSQIREALRPGDSLVLAGHSYGAAAVTVAAAYAIRDRHSHRVEGVLSFAAPRTTTGAGARLLSRYYPADPEPIAQRYVLGFDIVPWSVIPLGWHHPFRPAVFIASDGRSTSHKPSLFREAMLALRQRGVQAIGHHGMINYARWSRTVGPLL